MKISYIVSAGDEWEVKSYFARANARLRERAGFALWGATNPLGKGFYAITLQAIDGIFLGPVMLALLGILAMLVGFTSFGIWCFWIGVGASLLIMFFMHPHLHALIMRVALSRRLHHHVRVTVATTDYLARLAHGKI